MTDICELAKRITAEDKNVRADAENELQKMPYFEALDTMIQMTKSSCRSPGGNSLDVTIDADNNCVGEQIYLTNPKWFFEHPIFGQCISIDKDHNLSRKVFTEKHENKPSDHF
jgi:hypothetical protein